MGSYSRRLDASIHKQSELPYEYINLLRMDENSRHLNIDYLSAAPRV